MSVLSSNSIEQAMRKHQIDLNMEYPSLNNHGMMFFRDDDVEIGDDMCSILTIYQPLFDARDGKLINIRLDPEDPRVLYHLHPNVPTFMYQDYEEVYKMDKSDSNPEIFTGTRKKHKKHAFKIKNNKHLKLQMSEYHLPFDLTLESFDEIDNSGNEIMKHFRYIPTEFEADGLKIKQTCSWIFWKIMIDGEKTHCSAKSHDIKDMYKDAHERLRDPPGNFYSTHQQDAPFVGNVIDSDSYDIDDDDDDDDGGGGGGGDDEETSKRIVQLPNTVLNLHLARFSRYVDNKTQKQQHEEQGTYGYQIGPQQRQEPLASPNKKQKVTDVKPMDEDVDPDL